MQHLRDQARAAQSRKDYTNAIRLYDRAITRSPSAQLHDDRASCYENLNNIPLALKDAKAAIQLAKHDPIGYLRAGKLLTQMKQESVALEIYAHGLRSVKHTGSSFNNLKKIHDDTLAKLAPVRSVDPLTVLPNELAIAILEHLSFKQLVRSCSVSQTWNKFIRANPQLWTHLDLRDARKKVRHEFIVSAVQTCPDLHKVTLDCLQNFERSFELIRRLKSLKEITLVRTPRFGEAFYSGVQHKHNLELLHIENDEKIPGNNLRAVLKRCTNLLSLRCTTSLFNDIPDETLSHLHSLDIGFNSLNDNFTIASSELRHIRLWNYENSPLPTHDFSCFHNLISLELIWQQILLEHLRLPDSLEKIVLYSRKPVVMGSIWGLPTSTPATQTILHNLTHLEVWSPRFQQLNRLTCNILKFTEDTYARLEHLVISDWDFSQCKADSLEFQLFCQHPSLRSLKALKVPNAIAFDDSLLTTFIKSKPLTTLDVTKTDVTGYGLHATMDSITELNISGCRKVGNDFIDLAKSKGIRIRQSKKNVS